MPTLELPLQHPSLRAVFGAKGILPLRWRGQLLLGWGHCKMVWKHLWPLLRHAPPTQPPPGQGQSRWQSHWAAGCGEAEVGTWTYRGEPPQTWSFPKVPFPRPGSLFPSPSTSLPCMPSLGSPVQCPSPPSHSGDSSLLHKRRCYYLQPQILPMPFRLYTQPPARYPLIRFKGVGVGGVSGSVTGLGILPIYCQGC